MWNAFYEVKNIITGPGPGPNRPVPPLPNDFNKSATARSAPVSPTLTPKASIDPLLTAQSDLTAPSTLAIAAVSIFRIQAKLQAVRLLSGLTKEQLIQVFMSRLKKELYQHVYNALDAPVPVTRVTLANLALNRVTRGIFKELPTDELHRLADYHNALKEEIFFKVEESIALDLIRGSSFFLGKNGKKKVVGANPTFLDDVVNTGNRYDFNERREEFASPDALELNFSERLIYLILRVVEKQLLRVMKTKEAAVRKAFFKQCTQIESTVKVLEFIDEYEEVLEADLNHNNLPSPVPEHLRCLRLSITTWARISEFLGVGNLVSSLALANKQLFNMVYSNTFWSKVQHICLDMPFFPNKYDLPALFSRLENLKSLKGIKDSFAAEVIAQAVDNCDSLECIDISGCKSLKPQDVQFMLTECSSLRKIVLDRCTDAVSPSSVAIIVDLAKSSLESFHSSEVPFLNSESLNLLFSCKKMKSFKAGFNVDDPPLLPCPQHPLYTRFSAEAISKLCAQWKDLKVLDLSFRCPPAEEGTIGVRVAQFLEELPCLTELYLRDWHGYSDIENFNPKSPLRLERFDFSGSNDLDVKFLNAICPKIKTLRLAALSRCPLLNDKAVKALLSNCGSSLALLDISGSPKVTFESVSYLSRFAPQIKCLILDNTSVGDEAFGMLISFDSLSRLSIAHCNKVTDEGINALCFGLKSLTNLNVSHSSSFSPKMLDVLGTAPFASTLQSLQMSGLQQVCSKSLKSLEGPFRSIKRLDLSRNSLTAETLLSISTASFAYHLRHLNLAYNPALSSESCLVISQCFENLEVLILSFCQKIGDKGLDSLVNRLRKLQQLEVTGCTGLTKSCCEVLKKVSRRMDFIQMHRMANTIPLNYFEDLQKILNWVRLEYSLEST
jgi:hypothetical protein